MQSFIVKTFCLVLICGLVCGLSTSAKALPMLSFDVSDPSPIEGDQIIVDIVATDFTDLFAYNLDIGFDSSILAVNTVDPGSFLGTGGLTLGALGLFGFDISIPGQIQNISDSLLGPVPGVTGTGTLAHIKFDTLSVGNSSLEFLNISIGAGTEMIDSSGILITISSAPTANINVQSSGGEPIPEPSTVVLLGIGFLLLALTGFHRWRKQQVIRS